MHSDKVPPSSTAVFANINAFLLDKGLPRFHCLELIRFVDKFPSTPAGKIRKAILREQIIKEAIQENRDS